MLTFIIIVIVLALVFDFLNGFHDAANSIATVVSTRVLTPLQAVTWAAFFNFVAAFVFGTGVAKTIGKGLIDASQVDVYVVAAGVVGAILWNLLTWWLALPTSSSHALVGGYAGAAVAKSGLGVLIAPGWWPFLAFIVLSPLIGLILGGGLMIAVAWIFRRASPHNVDHGFRRAQLFSAAVYSLSHGTNDAQKTMGIIVALLLAGGMDQWTTWGRWDVLGTHHEYGMPIVLSCHFAIALGTLFGGWRIVKTMGQSITRLQPVGGFCAETGAATTIILATILKVPISTTHAITGSIIGVGMTRGVRSVRWIWGQRIVTAWILTIPCAAFVSAITYILIQWLVPPLIGH
jgi:PiT family inorganic phosphate transporter